MNENIDEHVFYPVPVAPILCVISIIAIIIIVILLYKFVWLKKKK